MSSSNKICRFPAASAISFSVHFFCEAPLVLPAASLQPRSPTPGFFSFPFLLVFCVLFFFLSPTLLGVVTCVEWFTKIPNGIFWFCTFAYGPFTNVFTFYSLLGEGVNIRRIFKTNMELPLCFLFGSWRPFFLWVVHTLCFLFWRNLRCFVDHPIVHALARLLNILSNSFFAADLFFVWRGGGGSIFEKTMYAYAHLFIISFASFHHAFQRVGVTCLQTAQQTQKQTQHLFGQPSSIICSVQQRLRRHCDAGGTPLSGGAPAIVLAAPPWGGWTLGGCCVQSRLRTTYAAGGPSIEWNGPCIHSVWPLDVDVAGVLGLPGTCAHMCCACNFRMNIKMHVGKHPPKKKQNINA